MTPHTVIPEAASPALVGHGDQMSLGPQMGQESQVNDTVF